MIKIKPGIGFANLDIAAKMHFNDLNPRSKRDNCYYKSSLIKKLRHASKSATPANKIVIDKIRENLLGIITGKPDVLNLIKNEIGRVSKSTNMDLHEILEKIFDYGNLRKNSKRMECFMKYMRCDVCPYCNRNFLTQIKVKNRFKGLFQLDHFFMQSDYPYLSLSFFNLIPSCAICNSQSKGKELFKLSTHIHPHLYQFDDILAFCTSIKDISFFYHSNPRFHLYLKPRSNPNISGKLIKRAKRSAKTFNLVQLYNSHQDFVHELIQKRMLYSNEQIDDLYDKYMGLLFSSRSEVERYVTGNYTDSNEIDKRPLAKLIKDVSIEFGLIKKK